MLMITLGFLSSIEAKSSCTGRKQRDQLLLELFLYVAGYGETILNSGFYHFKSNPFNIGRRQLLSNFKVT